MRQAVFVTFVFALCALPAFAQNSDDGAAAAVQPPAPPRAQEAGGGVMKTGSEWIQNIVRPDPQRNGFYAVFGSMPTASGISAGPGYRQHLFGGRAVVDASAAAAWSRGYFGQATFEVPHAIGEHVALGAQVTRQNFTRLSYFGIGPDTIEADGTNYGLNNTDYAAYTTVKPQSWLTVGGRLAYSQPVSIDRPRMSSLPATQDLFSLATAPALIDQPAFLHSDLVVDADMRNYPSRPTSGGDYRVTFSTFSDRDLGRYSFHRIEGEASQFIPILHENWVIALRARVASTDTADGNQVPFYLLPTLGGSRSLRGYDDYRFRDRDLLLLNAEYRWNIFGALDGAVFYDAGTVAPRFGDLDLTNLKTSYGLGFRFHSDHSTVFRVDVGHSTEGTRLLLSISDALKPGHGSFTIPYVP
jgi:Omp85 superfamily domain